MPTTFITLAIDHDPSERPAGWDWQALLDTPEPVALINDVLVTGDMQHVPIPLAQARESADDERGYTTVVEVPLTALTDTALLTRCVFTDAPGTLPLTHAVALGFRGHWVMVEVTFTLPKDEPVVSPSVEAETKTCSGCGATFPADESFDSECGNCAEVAVTEHLDGIRDAVLLELANRDRTDLSQDVEDWTRDTLTTYATDRTPEQVVDRLIAEDARPCGHLDAVESGCGGCDPGAVAFVLEDAPRRDWTL